MKTALLALAVLLVAGCDRQGPYVLAPGADTAAVYKMDTRNGKVWWCNPRDGCTALQDQP